MDGAVEGAVADVVVALLSSSKTASWRLLILSPLARFASPLNDRRPITIARVAVWSDGSVRQEAPGSARVRKRQHELLERVMRPAVNRHNGYSSFFITIFPMHE